MQHVRTAIAHGDMVGGVTYSMYQLAEELGMSRSPVREGLLRLAEIGVLEFAPNRGFRLITPTAPEVADMCALWWAIASAAAHRAARYHVAESPTPQQVISHLQDRLLILRMNRHPVELLTERNNVAAAIAAHDPDAAKASMQHHMANNAHAYLTTLTSPEVAAGLWRRAITGY